MTDTPNLPAPQQAGTAITAATFMPVLDIQSLIERRNAIVEFTKQVMVEGVDYGKIPGVDKPTLLQPGAEKLISMFGLTPMMEIVDKIEDWNGANNKGEPFFYYRVRCTMMRGTMALGCEEASCNSREVKYRYRLVSEHDVPPELNKAHLTVKDGAISEFEFAIEKAEVSGKYGKPAEYWQRFKDAIADGSARSYMKAARGGKEYKAWEIGGKLYRIPNPEIADVVNTILQMAEKRAKTRATRSCTGASEFFTQDVEDMEIIDVTPFKPAPTVATGAGTTQPTAEPAQGHQPAPGAAAGVPKAEGKPAKGGRGKKAAPAAQEPPAGAPEAQQGEQRTPPGGQSLEDQLAGATSMRTLVELFNNATDADRRPSTPLYKAFHKRREELMKQREAGNSST